jgi:hypothetical protein
MAGRYRSLSLSAISDDLIDLLAKAEANKASLLTFANMRLEHERERRDTKRIVLYRPPG